MFSQRYWMVKEVLENKQKRVIEFVDGRKVYLSLEMDRAIVEYPGNDEYRFIPIDSLTLSLLEEAERQIERDKKYFMFTKIFDSFGEGIEELAKVSFSAEDSLKDGTRRLFKKSLPETEGEAVAALASNAMWDRPTGNGVGWGEVRFSPHAEITWYITRGGVLFGWHPEFEDDYWSWEGGKYRFFVSHPSVTRREATRAPKNSTLRKSAEEHGWAEEEIDLGW